MLISESVDSRAEITVERTGGTRIAAGETVDFGSVSAGNSKAVQFILKNTGYAPLNAVAEVLNDPAFSLSAAPAAGVSPGEQTFLMVTFHSAAAGPRSAVLRISAEATDHSPFEIMLSGTGVASGPALIQDLTPPPGSGRFGHTVTVLPNGNFVVTDPEFDLPGPVKDAGAVHLYSSGGVLISTLTGASRDDRVGIREVVVLKNGNFVVQCPHWSNGTTVPNAGAVTWASGTTGVSGMVSPANSLTGSSRDDWVGALSVSITDPDFDGITVLENGNYVVCSPYWDHEGKQDAGAVTWCDGATGGRGAVTPENSLTGAAYRDFTGRGGATALKNGNYAVSSPFWNGERGAVTWGSGVSGVRGIVSESNSLTGSSAQDHVGSTVTALPSGHYIVCSPVWSDGNIPAAGAVTWCDGSTGCRGPVSAGNSLTGSHVHDVVGSGGVTVLTNGNYVVSSPEWDNGPVENAGAVTWGEGTTGLAGAVTEANSMTGVGLWDTAGSGGVTALTNGNYVICSPMRKSPEETYTGAVTWADGAAGLRGPLPVSDSLTGPDHASFYAGSGGVVALGNGNYVVNSPSGEAVTWRPGTIAAGAVISAENSLIGISVPPSRSEEGGGVVALTNGHYVVGCPNWTGNDTGRTVGAVIWCNGETGRAGNLLQDEALTGSNERDMVSGGGFSSGGNITPLNNGSYLVCSPLWDNESVRDAGAVTWGDGVFGSRGVVSGENSLTGGAVLEKIGDGVAVFANGHYAVFSRNLAAGGVARAGAVTLGTGDGPLTGFISADNSVTGATPDGGRFLNSAFRASDRVFFVGRPADNVVTLFRYHAAGPGPSVAVARSGGAELANGGALDFGEVATGASVSRAFTVKNTGGGAFSLGAVSVSDPRFAMTPAASTGALNPGESREFTVTFTPFAAGPVSAALTLTGGDPAVELFALTLTGTGKAPGGTGGPFGENGGAPRAERLADGRVRLSFKTLPGAGYLLQRSTDLTTWTAGVPVAADAEGRLLWNDETPPPGKVFYRLKVP